MDRINIKNLEVFARHGVMPKENLQGQKFLISAALYMDLRAAGKTDELAETLDYSRICCEIRDFVKYNRFDLIETVAEGLAALLLNGNRALQKVWVEVKKPWAPVDARLETISVEIERGRHTAYIALGSNMGDRETYLRFALGELDTAGDCYVGAVSSFYNTAPYGNTAQGDFLNGCAKLETLLTPRELLDLLHEIENKAGRVRNERWGPRTLDLDIILYDDIVMSDDALRIPHAEMHKRRFVLEPLCEIAPYALHPILKKPALELLDELGIEGDGNGLHTNA